MSDNRLLDISVIDVTSSQLRIRVKNSSGAALSKGLLIEINLQIDLAAASISDAARKASTSETNMASLDKVVTAAPGWSVWAFNESTGSIATIRVFNDTDQQTGEILEAPVKFEAGAEFTLSIPVTPQAGRVRFEIPYGYQYDEGGERVDDKLILTPSDGEKWEPNVSLTTNQQNPTMIEPGSEVELRWKIAGGVSATLRGPLPRGNSEVTLTTDRSSPYWIEQGSLKFIAVGPAIYTLDAEVRGPENKPNVRVIKTLQFDIYSGGKYGHLAVYPDRILPNGRFEVDWAVWGVAKAYIAVGDDYNFRLELTQQNLSRTYQGTGVWPFNAPDKPGAERIRLNIENDPKHKASMAAEISVAEWKDPKPEFADEPLAGKPLGLAVAAPKMALLTSEGLWTATVGEKDPTGPSELSFSKADTDVPKAWLALAAFDKNFVALRQTTKGDLQVAQYLPNGKPDGLGVDLPSSINALVGRGGTVFDLAVFGQRVYVVVEATVAGGLLRRAWSVRVKPQAEVRPEPLLETLAHYRLLTFDGALYAINRGSGQMFRFELTKAGRLEQPSKAASAVKDNRSMILQGLMVPVGSVLAVLGPSSTPALSSLPFFNLLKMLGAINMVPKKPAKKITQDLIYNPQQDQWTSCGHGLEIERGTVAAFRGGTSPRLWVLQPDGAMRTLAGAFEHLFAPEYVDHSTSGGKFPSKVPPPFLDKKRKFTIKNDSGMSFGQMNDACRMAGLDNFSSTGPAEVMSMPNRLQRGATATFELNYNEADPAPISLRFLAERAPAARVDHMLELTFSGADLSSVTSVLKRLAVDGQGTVSIEEVFGTEVQHSPNSTIEVPRPRRFDETVKLFIDNASPYRLKQSGLPSEPPYILDSQELKLSYNTPEFSILADEMGELRFNIDFAKPPGIETSSGSKSQKGLISINTDKAKGMDIRIARMLNKGDSPLELEGSKTTISASDDPVYVCRIGYQLKQELPGICLGDGVAPLNPYGDRIYLPIAGAQNVSQAQLCRIDADNLTVTQSVTFSSGGISSLTNSISLSRDKIFALFGERNLQILDYSLQAKDKKSLSDYDVVTGLKTTEDDEIYLLAMKEERTGPQDVKYHYMLVMGHANPGTGRFTELSLDSVRGIREQNRVKGAPAWVAYSTPSPMAIAPVRDARIGRKVAISIEGGLIVIEARSGKVDVVNLEPAGRQEDVVFDSRGEWIYCAHSQSGNQGLRISRVRASNLQVQQAISLPPGEVVSNLTADTRDGGSLRARYKNLRSASLFQSLDPKYLFVSQGRSILQIDTNSMTVLRSLMVELPCRLIHVTQGPNRCWLVYALGAAYTGDGSKVDQFKTHLYKLAIV